MIQNPALNFCNRIVQSVADYATTTVYGMRDFHNIVTQSAADYLSDNPCENDIPTLISGIWTGLSKYGQLQDRLKDAKQHAYTPIRYTPIPSRLRSAFGSHISRVPTPANTQLNEAEAEALASTWNTVVHRDVETLIGEYTNCTDSSFLALPLATRVSVIKKIINQLDGKINFAELQAIKELIKKSIGIQYTQEIFSPITSLDLSEVPITDQKLQELLQNFPNLRELNLTGCSNITDEGLRFIATLTALQQLRIRYSFKITDAGLECVTNLPNLQTLLLENCTNLTNAGFQHISKLKDLQELAITSYNLTDEGLAFVEQLEHLQKLCIDNCIRITNTGIRSIATLNNLQVLDLTHCAITDEGLEIMERLPLQKLDLRFCDITDRGLASIAKITTLQALGLGGGMGFGGNNDHITDVGAKCLAELPNLQDLRLIFCPHVTDATPIHIFSTLSKLQILSFHGCNSITDAGIVDIAKLPSLRELSFSGCHKITSEGLRSLEQLDNLQELNLSDCNIQNRGLWHLRNLQNLQLLMLKDPKITDFSPLASLHNLQELHLFKCKITDLSPLANLHKLKVLDLTACAKITDIGLMHLAELHKLQFLGLSYSGASIAGCRRIAELLHLSLDWDSVRFLP